jgi:two-component system response regulator YesN
LIKVLIVDDRSIIRKSIRAMSCWENNEMSIVGEAANGLEAIKLINDLSPHIVITDVKMPLMDGIELSKHIYEYFDNSIRTIILSAYDEFGYAQQAIKYGVSEYLLKPLKQEELVDAILNIKEKILNAQMASQDLRKSTDKEVIKEVKTVVDLAKEIVN